LVVVVGAWFVSVGMRADAATDRHQTAETAIQSGDYRTAYRQARIAAALDRSPDNLMSWGTAAYFLGRYETATEQFKAASQAGSREATLGWLASASQADDGTEIDAALAALGSTRDKFERAFVAQSLVRSGRLDMLDEQFAKTAPESGPETAARVVALAPTDQAGALLLLEKSPPGGVDVTASDPGVKKLATELMSLPEGARTKLATTVTAMQRPASEATRRLLLADRLLEFKRYRAAAALADTAVRSEPEYRDAWNTLAAAQLNLGNTDGAERSLDISIKLDRAFGYTWYLKSQLAEQADHPQDAKKFADQAALLGYQE
jgi:tetratricopeptide (TPR) repeat protein